MYVRLVSKVTFRIMSDILFDYDKGIYDSANIKHLFKKAKKYRNIYYIAYKYLLYYDIQPYILEINK